MKLAIIADVHGNAAALEAVLADIAPRHVDGVIDLGDRVSGPLWPARTFALFEENRILGVRGNHDRQLSDRPRTAMGASDGYAFDQLTAPQRDYLASLPVQVEPDRHVVAFHAHPHSDDVYLADEVAGERLVERPIADVERDLATFRHTLILCAHSHRPSARWLTGGRLLLNPGSVGCPAYADEKPPHVSESGAPFARYAIATLRGSAVSTCEHISVRYDWEKAAREAEHNGRPEWAFALRTGHMPRDGV